MRLIVPSLIISQEQGTTLIFSYFQFYIFIKLTFPPGSSTREKNLHQEKMEGREACIGL